MLIKFWNVEVDFGSWIVIFMSWNVFLWNFFKIFYVFFLWFLVFVFVEIVVSELWYKIRNVVSFLWWFVKVVYNCLILLSVF